MEKTLTSSSEILQDYVPLVLAWGVYFFIHSLLASDMVKAYFLNRKVSLKALRICYTIVSIVGLLALLFYNGLVTSDRLMAKSRELRIVAMFVAGVGVLVINAAFKQYNLTSFLGFSEEEGDLRKTGILGQVRHPIYSGTILITLGFFLYDPRPATLVSALCIYVYLVIGIRLEEKKLIKKFGQLYIEYKQEVPAVLPDIKKLFKHIAK